VLVHFPPPGFFRNDHDITQDNIIVIQLTGLARKLSQNGKHPVIDYKPPANPIYLLQASRLLLSETKRRYAIELCQESVAERHGPIEPIHAPIHEKITQNHDE
jgi:hypothetical protein